MLNVEIRESNFREPDIETVYRPDPHSRKKKQRTNSGNSSKAANECALLCSTVRCAAVCCACLLLHFLFQVSNLSLSLSTEDYQGYLATIQQHILTATSSTGFH
jgi:hypothetical protein